MMARDHKEIVNDLIKDKKAESNLQHPKRNGYYYSDGIKEFDKPLISVTKILQILNKPALMYWAARETARICLAEPWMTEDEAYAKFKTLSQEATSRGKGVHNYYKNFIQKGEEIPYPKQYAGYIEGIKKFYADLHPTHIYKNMIVKSFKYMYAGEIDSIDQISDLVWLLDIKTGGFYPEHTLQLSAYKQALSEDDIKIDRSGVLLLPGDFTYQLIETNAPIEKFLAVKNVWEQLGKE